MKIKNIWLHFKKICTHKHYVRQYCWKVGLYKRGLTHDLSKFSPTEFWEGVKYYQGDNSPIDACKKANGYSKAWLHHKGRNSHHYEHWQDNFDNGGNPLLMPFEDSAEMLCDYLGAGHAYWGKDFTYKKELFWWENKKSNPLAMHPINKEFISQALKEINEKGIAFLNKKNLLKLYNELKNSWTGMEDIFW